MEFSQDKNAEMAEYEEMLKKKEEMDNYVESLNHELNDAEKDFEKKTEIQHELQTENVQNEFECEIETHNREQVKLELEKNYKLFKESVAQFNELTKFVKYKWEFLNKLETYQKRIKEKLENITESNFEKQINDESDLIKQLTEQFKAIETELELKRNDFEMKRNNLKQMNEDLENNIKELEKENLKIDSERDKLIKLKKEHTNESNDLDKKMEDFVNTTQQTKMELKTKIDHLNVIKSNKITSESLLESEIQVCQDKIEAQDIVLNDMNKCVNNIEHELIDLVQENTNIKYRIETHLEQIELEREEFKTKINISDSENYKLFENTAKLEREVHDLEMIANNNANLKTELEINNQNESDELAELQNRLNISNATFEDNKVKYINSINELGNELKYETERKENVKSEQKWLENKLRILKESRVNLENQYQNMEAVSIKNKVENNLKIDKLKQELEQYKNELKEEEKIILGEKSDERLNGMREKFKNEKMIFIKQTEKHVKEMKTSKRQMLKQKEEEIQKAKSLYMRKQLELSEMKAASKAIETQMGITVKQIEKCENKKKKSVLLHENETLLYPTSKSFSSDDNSQCISTPEKRPLTLDELFDKLVEEK